MLGPSPPFIYATSTYWHESNPISWVDWLYLPHTSQAKKNIWWIPWIQSDSSAWRVLVELSMIGRVGRLEKNSLSSTKGPSKIRIRKKKRLFFTKWYIHSDKKPFRSWVIALITLFCRRITNKDSFKGSWVSFTSLVGIDMYKGYTPKDPWGKPIETIKFWKI